MSDTNNIVDDKKKEELKYDTVHNTPLEEILAADDGSDWEQNSDVKPTLTEDKAEEKVEVKAEEAKPETKTEEVAFDPEEFKTQLKGEISQQVAKEVVDALTGGKDKTTAEEKELKDLMDSAPWIKENRDPTANEVIAWTVKNSTPLIKQQVLDELNQEMETEEKAEADRIRVATENQTKTNEELFTYWDSQIADLQNTGKLAKIVNDKDPNDRGVQERMKLFETMKKVSDERAARKEDPILNLKEIYYEYYEPSKQPAGADAPIAGARRTVSQSDNAKISYDQIHNANFEDLLTGRV